VGAQGACRKHFSRLPHFEVYDRAGALKTGGPPALKEINRLVEETNARQRQMETPPNGR